MLLSFLEHFSELEDPRYEGFVTYPLPEILLAALVGTLCGGENWEEIVLFCEEKLDLLRQFLPYQNGIASPKTFWRSRRKSKQAQLAYGLLIAAFPINGEAKAQLVNFNPNNPAESGYTIAFDDEFEGPVLNLSKWNTGWAWNNGLGTNTSTYPYDEALPENITLSEGVANFAITRGPTPHGLPYGTSVANTWGKFNQTYGYWEIRLEMPNNAAGAWPAFWLVPETFAWPPEIDIMEWLGNLSTTDFMTLHYTQNGALKQSGASSQVLNFNTAFHQLGLLWTPSSVTWYIDGLQVAQSTSGIPSQPMYMILNIDTGGWSGNAIGLTTVFPIQLKVDYVRVWSAPR